MTSHSSSLKFSCPFCSTNLNAPAELFGARIQCPSCQTELVVPVPEEAAKTEVLLDGGPESSACPTRIWNPSHAANLTVLLCPALGPAVHAMNWKALGQPDLARRSWVWASIIAAAILTFLVLSAVLPEAARSWGAVVILLVFVWYFTLGRKQISAAKQYHGTLSFRPLLPVVGAGAILTGVFLGAGILATDLGDRKLMEKAAAPLVSEILANSLGADAADCLEVKLGEKLAKNIYKATATLDNGNVLGVTVQRQEDQVIVRITSLLPDSFSAPPSTGDAVATTESADSAPAPGGNPDAANKGADPVLVLGLPRSGAKDFASMAAHYGFGDYGTPMLDNFPSVAWQKILNEDKHQVQYLKAVLKSRGCTREEWYGINDKSGALAPGSFRSKSQVLCATLPVGLYTVIEKKGDRLLLTQSNEVKGTALWPEDWRTLMGAMPLQVLLDGGGIGAAAFAVEDRVSFIGIQTTVVEQDVFTPAVRPLGVRNETTGEFFNLENPASPRGELAGAVKAAAEAAARAAKAEEEQAARKADDKRQADEAEATLQKMAENAEQRRKEWLHRGSGDTAEGDDPFASVASVAKPKDLPADLAAAKAELEKVTSTIESERQRWLEALATINRLTVNKTRPVREGSPQYQECMAASQVIQEVEQGAQALKDRKAALEARVKELEK